MIPNRKIVFFKILMLLHVLQSAGSFGFQRMESGSGHSFAGAGARGIIGRPRVSAGGTKSVSFNFSGPELLQRAYTQAYPDRFGGVAGLIDLDRAFKVCAVFDHDAGCRQIAHNRAVLLNFNAVAARADFLSRCRTPLLPAR